jgi:hypothetical protein
LLELLKLKVTNLRIKGFLSLLSSVEAHKAVPVGDGRDGDVNVLVESTVHVLNLDDGGGRDLGGFHLSNVLEQLFELTSGNIFGDVRDKDILSQVGGDLVGSEEVSVERETTALPCLGLSFNLLGAIGHLEVLNGLGDLLELCGVNLDDADAVGRREAGGGMRTGVTELDGLLNLKTASLLDDLVDSDRGSDAPGEVVQVDNLSGGVSNGGHSVYFLFEFLVISI